MNELTNYIDKVVESSYILSELFQKEVRPMKNNIILGILIGLLVVFSIGLILFIAVLFSGSTVMLYFVVIITAICIILSASIRFIVVKKQKRRVAVVEFKKFADNLRYLREHLIPGKSMITSLGVTDEAPYIITSAVVEETQSVNNKVLDELSKRIKTDFNYLKRDHIRQIKIKSRQKYLDTNDIETNTRNSHLLFEFNSTDIDEFYPYELEKNPLHGKKVYRTNVNQIISFFV